MSGVLRVFWLGELAWTGPVKPQWVLAISDMLCYTLILVLSGCTSVYLQYIFESGLHAAKLITVHEQNIFKYTTRIGTEKCCFDKPRLITHTFHPHQCPYSTDLAIF